MKYNYKQDFKHIFDTPAKMEQESVVVSKIMELLNKGKYDNIYDFVSKNPTYQDFLKKHSLENVVRHFGNTLSEEDFKKIQSELVKITEKKKSFEKENLKTTNIGDHQYITYEGTEKTVFLDNTHTKDNMSIERQLEVLQPTQQEFQTTNATQNTDKMIDELEESKKESFNLQYLKDVNIDNLSERKKQILEVAKHYQLNVSMPIRIDLEREVIVDELNSIMKIEQVNGEFVILGKDNNQKDSIEKTEIKESNSFQKKLVPSPNTLYSENK